MFYKNKPVPVDLKTPIYPGGPTFRVPERVKKLRERQAFFLANQDVPVYLARGTRDVIQYRATMGLMTVGLGYMSYIMYKMAYGIK